MRCLTAVCTVLLALSSHAWIDYDDAVVRKTPSFGKAFQGFSLRLATEEVEFEQDSREMVTVTLRNATDATTLRDAAENRQHVLNLILATENGDTFVSRNLLQVQEENPISRRRVPPNASIEVLQIPFDDLLLARFTDYKHGIPFVEADTHRVSGAALVPQIYVMKALLYSYTEGARPDFAVASDTWPILLRPKSGDRMSQDERTRKMQSWLAKMKTGAYGGIGVSSQLAALGEAAVDPLIELAEKKGTDEKGTRADQVIRESRIWALVTLCNTGSPKAEKYILKRLWNPISFGDLSFITWHSQGFGSERVTEELRRFAEDAACGRPMPWETMHGQESRRHARGALEFLFKHFISRNKSITDKTMAGVVALDNPKLQAFGIMAWQPHTLGDAAAILLPLITEDPVHPNVKKAILACLARAGEKQGFPAYDREGDVQAQWLQGCQWLQRSKHMTEPQLRNALRWLVLDVPRENEALQTALIAALARRPDAEFPVDNADPSLPRDWVRTWQWALRTAPIDSQSAISFCTNMMRTRDDLPEVVKRGLLAELKRLIGDEFPFNAADAQQIDTEWVACGRWLIDNGYFKQKNQ